MKRTGAFAAIVLALATTGIARAGDRPSIGITLNATIGSHQESTGTERVPLLPLPLFDLRVPFRHFEAEVEGVPAFGPVGYDSGITSAVRTTRISYMFGTLRYRIPNSPWSAGLGAILYNQSTVTTQTFLTACPGGCSGPSSITETDASRVGGLRYEVGYTASLSPLRSLALSIGITPVMHASIHEDIEPFHDMFVAPETASQVDGQLRFAMQARNLTWAYGLRYINYLAHFDSNGALSDRNTLVMPFAGVSFLLGR